MCEYDECVQCEMFKQYISHLESRHLAFMEWTANDSNRVLVQTTAVVHALNANNIPKATKLAFQLLVDVLNINEFNTTVNTVNSANLLSAELTPFEVFKEH